MNLFSKEQSDLTRRIKKWRAGKLSSAEKDKLIEELMSSLAYVHEELAAVSVSTSEIAQHVDEALH